MKESLIDCAFLHFALIGGAHEPHILLKYAQRGLLEVLVQLKNAVLFMEKVNEGTVAILVENIVGQPSHVALRFGEGRHCQVVELQLQQLQGTYIGLALAFSLSSHLSNESAEVEQKVGEDTVELKLQETGDEYVVVGDDFVALGQQQVSALAAVF